MSAHLKAIVTNSTRGAYVPVRNTSKDEESDGIADDLHDAINEKRSGKRDGIRSFIKPVLQCFLVAALMGASYAFGAYSASNPTSHSIGFVPDSAFTFISLTNGSC